MHAVFGLKKLASLETRTSLPDLKSRRWPAGIMNRIYAYPLDPREYLSNLPSSADGSGI